MTKFSSYKIAIFSLGFFLFFSTPAFSQGWVFEKIESNFSPKARFGCGLTYDSSRECSVLFGGSEGSRETWELHSDGWKAIQSSKNPSSRISGGLVFFPKLGATVLFGGLRFPFEANNYIMLGDTWVYSATGWEELKLEISPPPRAYPGLVFDSHRNLLILFGGKGEAGELNDTWEFDGQNWREIQTSRKPSPRSGHSMTFDQRRGAAIVYGGNSNDVQIWEYRNGDWTPKFFRPSPGSKTGSSMVFDSEMNVSILCGGTTPSNSTQKENDLWKPNVIWLYSGKGWKPVKVDTDFPGYLNPSVCYDPKRDSLICFGGISLDKQNEPQFSKTTWSLKRETLKEPEN